MLVFLSGTAGCSWLLKDDKVFSGLSGGEGERSDELELEFELESAGLGLA